MKHAPYSNGIVKFATGWVLVFLVRLVPFRAPNIEPVLATTMPFAKRYGPAGAFLFGSLSIVLFDLAVGKAGLWTLITGAAYGLVGAGAHFFLRNRKNSRQNYVLFALMGTLAYDAATGLTVGPLLFGQSFHEALVGQIPFTLWHLLGNISFAAILSPAVFRWVVENPKLETNKMLSFART